MREFCGTDPSDRERSDRGGHREYFAGGVREGVPGVYHEHPGSGAQHDGYASGTADRDLFDTVPVVFRTPRTVYHFRGMGILRDPYEAENMANYAAGAPVDHIFTFGLFYAVLQVTGSGLTLDLVAMMMRSRAKSLKSIGTVGIVTSLFGINEPIIFGAPIILNPFLFIPFVFGPLVITVITYLSMTSGLVGKPIAGPPGFLPPGVGAFIMTLNWEKKLKGNR